MNQLIDFNIIRKKTKSIFGVLFVTLIISVIVSFLMFLTAPQTEYYQSEIIIKIDAEPSSVWHNRMFTTIATHENTVRRSIRAFRYNDSVFRTRTLMSTRDRGSSLVLTLKNESEIRLKNISLYVALDSARILKRIDPTINDIEISSVRVLQEKHIIRSNFDYHNIVLFSLLFFPITYILFLLIHELVIKDDKYNDELKGYNKAVMILMILLHQVFNSARLKEKK